MRAQLDGLAAGYALGRAALAAAPPPLVVLALLGAAAAACVAHALLRVLDSPARNTLAASVAAFAAGSLADGRVRRLLGKSGH